jgi:hypothetical protein
MGDEDIVKLEEIEALRKKVEDAREIQGLAGQDTTESFMRCADHKLAPWRMVCRHLLDDPKLPVVRAVHGHGRQDDFLCSACAEKAKTGDDSKAFLDDLKCLCIYCAKDILGDPK